MAKPENLSSIFISIVYCGYELEGIMILGGGHVIQVAHDYLKLKSLPTTQQNKTGVKN